MIPNLVNSQASFGGGIVCPTAPFNPATLSLSLWMEGRDCPTSSATPWPSRASAGTSGLLSAGTLFGSVGPQSLAGVPGVAPCGLNTSQFRASPYAVLGLSYVAGTTDIIPGTDGTVVAAFKYVLGRTSGVAPRYDSCIAEAFDAQWRVHMNASGQARVSCTTGSGVLVATTSNSVSPGDWCFVVVKFDSSGASVTLNGGTPATLGTAKSSLTQDRLLLGFQGTFGEILDMNLGVLQIANSVLSAGDITNLKAYADWYVGTTI